MSKWSARDGILARHAGHDLRAIDARSVRCMTCTHTLLLDANREVAAEPAAQQPTLTEGQRRAAELRAQREAALAAAAPPERVARYAAQIREQLAQRPRRGATS